jgi:CHAT domain-containing protein
VKPLKATKEEASSIQKIFKDHTQLYVEIEANEEHFRQTQHSSILHMATHGIVVENDEEKEPLLKIALALTGYNTSIKKEKDYGVLTGLKIASLNLEKTKLVVLSACETAVGHSDNIIGVSSLSRAFMIAGAKSTIASLWEVDDEGTKAFFDSFYQKAKTDDNYAEVFKQTQREIYNKTKEEKDHPLFWAGFAFFGSV